MVFGGLSWVYPAPPWVSKWKTGIILNYPAVFVCYPALVVPFAGTSGAAQRHRACAQLDKLSRALVDARAALGAARENNVRLQERLSVREGSDDDERDAANLAAARAEGAVAEGR